MHAIFSLGVLWMHLPQPPGIRRVPKADSPSYPFNGLAQVGRQPIEPVKRHRQGLLPAVDHSLLCGVVGISGFPGRACGFNRHADRIPDAVASGDADAALLHPDGPRLAGLTVRCHGVSLALEFAVNL